MQINSASTYWNKVNLIVEHFINLINLTKKPTSPGRITLIKPYQNSLNYYPNYSRLYQAQGMYYVHFKFPIEKGKCIYLNSNITV